MTTGFHGVFEKGFYEAVDNARLHGFDFVQFDLNIPRFFLNTWTAENLCKLRQYAESKGIQITLHAPCDNVSLFSDFPLIRKGILDEFKLILEKANFLGARHLTIHAGEHPKFRQSGQSEDLYTAEYQTHYEAVLYENIKELILTAGNVMICLENHKLDRIIMDVVEKCIDEKYSLFLTLDTAKMYTPTYEFDRVGFNFMMAHQDQIREIHISDFNRAYGSHQIPGTGIVDFTLVKELLHKQNIFVNIEVRPLEAAVIAREKLHLM